MFTHICMVKKKKHPEVHTGRLLCPVTHIHSAHTPEHGTLIIIRVVMHGASTL